MVLHDIYRLYSLVFKMFFNSLHHDSLGQYGCTKGTRVSGLLCAAMLQSGSTL